ncbi:GTPase Era [Halioxenophilus aromaticivorans]|uniref:GTPase Era n=1 Tax=Halioxenophilus aromaticivorans TaxID=1306992 RepID=A0AAV3TWB2_9ALTE
MTKRCGYVAIVGRPNVGKSTLLNHILGQKLSITSRKPQTTRHNLLGIYTEGDVQAMFVDTPGLHRGQDKALNRYMNRSATNAYKDVDLVLFLVDKNHWTEEDQWIANRIAQSGAPVVLVVNKIDQIEDKDSLLPHLKALSDDVECKDIIPISALRNNNLDRLLSVIESYLPEGEFFFPEDQITDRSSRFLAAEIVREKITRQLGEELPYQMTVEIEEFSFDAGVLHISALILVERKGQKKILIGVKGEKIKQIGQQSREDMETMFDNKVMLNLWVKVKSGWSDDERALRSLGYDDSDFGA